MPKLLTPNPRLSEIAERHQRLVEQRRAAPIQKVEVEAIGSQTPQTAFAGGDCALARTAPENRR